VTSTDSTVDLEAARRSFWTAQMDGAENFMLAVQ